MHRPILFLVALALALPARASAQSISIQADLGNARIAFALQHLGDALTARNETSRILPRTSAGAAEIVLTEIGDDPMMVALRQAGGRSDPELEPEGFSLQRTGGAGGTIWVIGADDAGIMYGALELAEQIRLTGRAGVQEMDRNPYMATRGTKFNIPLDARTPSYSDMSDVAQYNIATMWDLEFWKEYLDDLALHRYNLVSLWNLHPFPSMVRVPEYPEIALDDVMRSTAEFAENYSTRVVDLGGPEILTNLETIKEITIADKIEFWREVMRYAHDRNIDFYVMTWNIYTYGTDGKYGITDSFDNETTVDYFRRSVAAMFDTYPLLKGIGITTGENFGQNANAASFSQKEDWAFRSYGQGLLDAAARSPEREFVFVHRLHETGVQSDAAAYAANANVAAVDIRQWFQPLVDNEKIDFLFSFKYAQAHVYSSTRQNFHEAYVEDIKGMKTLWTLRNDDVYYFRWGAPDFVRGFYRNMPGDEVSQGVYYGSDQYVWGREFLSRTPSSPRQIEVDKHWFQWMLWGRLAYDPEVSNDRFIALVENRFPSADGDRLLAAWQEASMIYPITTGFHWGLYDFHWYIEASKGRAGTGGSPSGFHDVNRFITLGPHPGTDYRSIPDYVRDVTSGADSPGTTPLQVSAQLLEHADRAVELVSGLDHSGDAELRATINDIVTIAHLGRYYGHKIAGATELALFRETGSAAHRHAAIDGLRRAATSWRLYVAYATSQYTNPLWTNRVGHVDWRLTMGEVLNDIVIAGGEPVLPSMDSSLPGVILEAETARHGGGTVLPGSAGSTGTGAVRLDASDDDAWIEWTFETESGGTSVVELRYAMGDGVFPAFLVVNGGESQPFPLWTTGGPTTWAWDRIPVTLDAGTNSIRLQVSGSPIIDHLRIESDR